jgi:hypothetical protein
MRRGPSPPLAAGSPPAATTPLPACIRRADRAGAPASVPVAPGAPPPSPATTTLGGVSFREWGSVPDRLLGGHQPAQRLPDRSPGLAGWPGSVSGCPRRPTWGLPMPNATRPARRPGLGGGAARSAGRRRLRRRPPAHQAPPLLGSAPRARARSTDRGWTRTPKRSAIALARSPERSVGSAPRRPRAKVTISPVSLWARRGPGRAGTQGGQPAFLQGPGRLVEGRTEYPNEAAARATAWPSNRPCGPSRTSPAPGLDPRDRLLRPSPQRALHRARGGLPAPQGEQRFLQEPTCPLARTPRAQGNARAPGELGLEGRSAYFQLSGRVAGQCGGSRDPVALERQVAAEGRRAARELYRDALRVLDREATAAAGGARQRLEEAMGGNHVRPRPDLALPSERGARELPSLDRSIGLAQSDPSPALREAVCDLATRPAPPPGGRAHLPAHRRTFLLPRAGRVTARLHGTNDDRERRLNGTENVGGRLGQTGSSRWR